MGLTGAQIEPPAVHACALVVQARHPDDSRIAVLGQVREVGQGLCLDATVHHDLIALLVRVRQVKQIAGLRLEPLDVSVGAISRQHTKTARDVTVEAQSMTALCQGLGIKKEGQVVNDRVVLRHAQIMRPARTG